MSEYGNHLRVLTLFRYVNGESTLSFCRKEGRIDLKSLVLGVKMLKEAVFEGWGIIAR